MGKNWIREKQGAQAWHQKVSPDGQQVYAHEAPTLPDLPSVVLLFETNLN
jgi:hypothetical protein